MIVIRVKDEEGPDGEITVRIWPGVKAEITARGSGVTMHRDTFRFFLTDCFQAMEELGGHNGDAADVQIT